MISTAHRFIFIHAHKTGGNSVQLVLEPLSDDRREIWPGQDGQDRFGISGPITRNKHAPLRTYAAVLGAELDGYRIIVGARDPLARAVSFYFSPHRWFGRRPVFERSRFESEMQGLPTIASMLKVGGIVRRPDYILRMETLAEDLAHLERALPLPPLPALPHVNISVANQSLRDETLADPWVCSLVAERFADDYTHLI